MAGCLVVQPDLISHRHTMAATATGLPAIIPAVVPAGPHLYQPRYHQKTKLYHLVRDNLDEFLRVYNRRFAETYGPLRPEVERSFRAFLKCGVPEEGFATFHCADCHNAFIVPFSCKNWLCPSCSAKRTLDWAMWLTTEVLYDQPHYHIVATLPPPVREVYLKNRGLLGYLARSLAQMLQWYLKDNCEHPRALPGVIVVTQTFGEKLNPNPHFHSLATTMNVDTETGGFFDTRLPSFWQLRQNWMNCALRLALNMKKLTIKQCMQLKLQYPKGFHVHVSLPEQRQERQFGQEKETRAEILASVGKYLVRTPLTEARIAAYDIVAGTVTLRHRGYEFGDDGLLHKKAKPDFETIDPLELLARLSVHVPLPHRHHCRYYGSYSVRFRGKLRAEGIIPNPAAEGKLRQACRQSWAKLIRLVYQDDPLLCPACGGTMKLKGLTSPSEARAKFALLRPILLYWRDGKTVRALPLQQVRPPP
jgi:hypothetical protein